MQNPQRLSKQLQYFAFGLVMLVFLIVTLVYSQLWPGWFTYMFLGISVLGLMGELLNIATISRKAKQDPSLLDRRVP